MLLKFFCREDKIKELHELKRRVLAGHYGPEEEDSEVAAAEKSSSHEEESIVHDPPPRPSPPPISLDKMPEKGILKKGPRQRGRRLKKGLRLTPGDQGQLPGSQMSGSETESKEGSKLELAGGAKEDQEKAVSGSECGSGVCSDYESMDTERESLLKSYGGERSGTLDSRILESPASTGSQGSKEHLDAEGKVVHIRNIDDLIKNIEEQVVRQSPSITEDLQDSEYPDSCQSNLLRPEDVKSDANVQTSPLEFSHPVHITDNPLFPLDEAGSESGSSESARSTNSGNGAHEITTPVSPEPILMTAPAPPCGPLLNFSPLHIGLQTQHHAEFSPEDNLFTCTHFSPVSSPRESYPKSCYSPMGSPNESPYKQMFTPPPPRLLPTQFTPQMPIIPGQTGLNQNIGKLSSFLPRPDYVPLPPTSPAHSSSGSSNCSSVVKSDSPKEEKDNIPRIWQAPNRNNIPARRGPAVLSGHFGQVPLKTIRSCETTPESDRKFILDKPPGGQNDNVPSAPQQFYSFLPRYEKDPVSGESITYPPQTGRPRSCASPPDGNHGLPQKPRSRPASTSFYKPILLPKPNIPASGACASQGPDDRPTKPNNLPLTNNFHSKSPNSPEFYKTFSPIFPPHLLSADHFRVTLNEDELSSEENMNNDLSPSQRRAPHSPECNINPYSPDISPNEQPARSKSRFPIGIQSNLNTGSKAKPWNSRNKNFAPEVGASEVREMKKKQDSAKRGKKKKKKAVSAEEKMRTSSTEAIDNGLILDV
jgi:hypothetical protein